MTLRRSNSYNDPSKTKKPKEMPWNTISNCPKDHIEKVIRPIVLASDISGCQKILDKINRDHDKKMQHRNILQLNRQNLRDKLKKRH